jgi:hypothetical protein
VAHSTNPLSYTNYDFDALKTELINRLKVTDAWKDTYESGTGTMIIEFYAYIGELLLYYLERRAEESYLATAQNKSSVLNIIKLIRYSPKRKVSAVGSLRITLSEASSAIVYVPKYTVCQTASGINYMINRDVSIISPNLSVVAEGIQGVKIDSQYTGDGSISQSFAVNDTSVENTNYTVLVEGEEWTEVSTFISSVGTSKHYRVEHEIDDTLTFHFGDNVRGLAPAYADTIIFRYVRSDGLAGNVYQQDKIVTLVDAIYDEDSVEVDATITNTTTFTAGDDAEDIEEIRSEAPQVFQTGDRAVTRADFRAILTNYPSIADANAWGENEESPPNYNMFNTAKLCIVLEDWQHPTDSFKTTLGIYLYLLSVLTIKYEYQEATFIEVVPTLDVLVNLNYSLSAVQAEIATTLAEQFTLGTTSKLGISQNYSNVVHSIDELAGVNHHHLELQIRKNLTAGGGYDWTGVLDAVHIKRGSVYVYAQSGGGTDHIMAYDDEAGNFTDASSSYTVTGDVDYDTGVIGIDFDPDTDISGVYARYQQNSLGDVDVLENQICKLYEVDVTAIGYVEE